MCIRDFVERKHFGYLGWKGARLYPIDAFPWPVMAMLASPPRGFFVSVRRDIGQV
jgi:hypothetical protein